MNIDKEYQRLESLMLILDLAKNAKRVRKHYIDSIIKLEDNFPELEVRYKKKVASLDGAIERILNYYKTKLNQK